MNTKKREPGYYWVKYYGEWTVVQLIGPENFSRMSTVAFVGGPILPLAASEKQRIDAWGPRIELPEEKP